MRSSQVELSFDSFLANQSLPYLAPGRSGYSDQRRAAAPVTNGQAALVPEKLVGIPSGLRLVTSCPGAPSPLWPIDELRLESSTGRPARFIEMIGFTHGSFVMHEPPMAAGLPAAATTSTPLFAAYTKAARREFSSRAEQRETPQLKLMIRAPALIVSIIAAARTSGREAGTSSMFSSDSPKMGRSSNVQSGQMAGVDARRPINTPATRVPCMQAAESGRRQEPLSIGLDETSLILEDPNCGKRVFIGPSISATAISGRPRVSDMRRGRFTMSNMSDSISAVPGRSEHAPVGD